MKRILFIVNILFLYSISLYSQSGSINNTLGTDGIFKIKDNSTTFFSLDQSDGELTLSGSLVLPSMGFDSENGAIFRGFTRFIHNFQPSTATGGNTFIGLNSGNFSMTASNSSEASFNTSVGQASMYSLTTGYFNSAFGYQALNKNTSGRENSAFGYHSLFSNTTGVENTAFGNQSLESNTDGYQNSAFGYYALNTNVGGYQNSAFGSYALDGNDYGNNNSAFGNLTLSNNAGHNNNAFGMSALGIGNDGSNNSAFGYNALKDNTLGDENSAFGNNALSNNTDGKWNSAFGYSAMLYNTGGDENCAFGYGALSNTSNQTGNRNTAFGRSAGSDLTGGTNNIMIGYNAQVSNSSGNNQVRIGNSNIALAEIEVSWTITSDRRAKSNITRSDLGLDFISKLRPVSYFRKNDEKKRTEFGFIAQDVEKLLEDFNVKNSGMITVNDSGTYSMRYDDLFAPIVKSVQQLKEKNNQLEEKLNLISEENNILKEKIASIRNSISEQIIREVKNILQKTEQTEKRNTKVSHKDSAE